MVNEEVFAGGGVVVAVGRNFTLNNSSFGVDTFVGSALVLLVGVGRSLTAANSFSLGRVLVRLDC